MLLSVVSFNLLWGMSFRFRRLVWLYRVLRIAFSVVSPSIWSDLPVLPLDLHSLLSGHSYIFLRVEAIAYTSIKSFFFSLGWEHFWVVSRRGAIEVHRVNELKLSIYRVDAIRSQIEAFAFTLFIKLINNPKPLYFKLIGSCHMHAVNIETFFKKSIVLWSHSTITGFLFPLRTQVKNLWMRCIINFIWFL